MPFASTPFTKNSTPVTPDTATDAIVCIPTLVVVTVAAYVDVLPRLIALATFATFAVTRFALIVPALAYTLPAVRSVVTSRVPTTFAPAAVTVNTVLPATDVITLPSVVGMLTLELPLVIAVTFGLEVHERLPVPSVART